MVYKSKSCSENRDTPSPADYNARLCGARKYITDAKDGKDVQCSKPPVFHGGYCKSCIRQYVKIGFFRDGDVRVTGNGAKPNVNLKGEALYTHNKTHPMLAPAGELIDQRDEIIKRLFPITGNPLARFQGKGSSVIYYLEEQFEEDYVSEPDLILDDELPDPPPPVSTDNLIM
jgi:hypothetical protein